MKRNWDEVFFEALVTGDTGRAVMNQEKRGQGDFNSSDVLPKDLRDCTREQLEQLGFVFGEDVDDLFVKAKLPAGWQKRGTEHSMWSEIADDKGRVRGQVFYKAAFYDRNAHMFLTRRYHYGSEPINGYGENHKDEDPDVGYVKDEGARIWKTAPRQIPAGGWKIREELDAEAKSYIEEHYPDHKNPLAYWD